MKKTKEMVDAKCYSCGFIFDFKVEKDDENNKWECGECFQNDLFKGIFELQQEKGK